MIRIVLGLNDAEAKALRAMCRAWRFDDAQHFLRHSPNIKPASLCEVITRLRDAFDADSE
jgi:hypothetical protein